MFQTPILFIIFNRPNTTNKVFERIKRIRPRALFIAADGVRVNYPKDIECCQASRAIVNKIDWDCTVKTLFRTENLGCGKAVSEAITWFFENVEQGIILEDDCLPDISFFYFCELMLNRYGNEQRVMQITGTNYLFNTNKSLSNSYYFSAYNSIWGWATWRRAWQYYDYNLENAEEAQIFLPKRFYNIALQNWLLASYREVEENKIDTWDFQWNFIFQKMNGLCVTPSVNLISNIGYFGTHYFGKTHLSNIPTSTFSIHNIIEGVPLAIDFEKDNHAAIHLTNFKRSVYQKIENKIRRFLRLNQID